MIKSIATYCKQDVPGWMPLPIGLLFHEVCSFLRPADGIQMIASIKEYNAHRVIHVSIGYLASAVPDRSPDVWEEIIYKEVPRILQEFFGDRGFAQQPVDPRHPSLKHYFSSLEE